jgi:two-component system response regulator YesN
MNIIIVDDEPYIRKILSNVIGTRPNWQVVAQAENGEEALNYCIKLKPHVVLTDVRMPLVNGLDLTKRIKELMQDIEVVILTAYSDFSYAQQAIRIGAFDYLVKPVSKGDIFRVLENIECKLIKGDLKTEGRNQPIKQSYTPLVNKMIMLAEKNYDKDVSLINIANELGRNADYLSNLFKQEVGINFIEFITSYRIQKAKEYLTFADLNIYRVAELVGFKDQRYFSRVFKTLTSMTPHEFKIKNQGDHS